MKKVIIFICGLFLMTSVASAQGVDDRAVIPVAVTLNSILRLNVVSGGNIEFNFNTLKDYTSGISNSDGYNTKFTVASSVNWEVVVYAEEAILTGTDNEGGVNTRPVDNIGYQVATTGTGAGTAYIIPSLSAVVALTSAETTLVGNGVDSNAGDISQNAFTIQWRCGTSEGDMAATSILAQSVAPDRYATNVFISLIAVP